MTSEEINRVKALVTLLEKEGPTRVLHHGMTVHDLHIVLDAALAHVKALEGATAGQSPKQRKATPRKKPLKK